MGVIRSRASVFALDFLHRSAHMVHSAIHGAVVLLAIETTSCIDVLGFFRESLYRSVQIPTDPCTQSSIVDDDKKQYKKNRV